MIYVNDSPLDLNTVKLPDGKFYNGTDEIKMMFAGAWRELEMRFWDRNENLVFITPSIKSGNKKGDQGYWYPRVVTHRTSKGMVKIAWAEKIKNEGGSIAYEPVIKHIGPHEKTLTLTRDDIEEALFMFLFNPNVITEKNPSGKTYLQDLEREAEQYEKSEQEGSIVPYWLFRETSPFYADDNRLSTLCLYWGINPENKSNAYRKQLLAESIKKNDRAGNQDFGSKTLDSICRRMMDGNDVRDVDTMALVQKCIVAKILRFNDQKFTWVLLGTNGNELKTFCKVPPQSVHKNREYIKKHLLSNQDDVDTLWSSLGVEPKAGKHDIASLEAPLPDPVTREYIENTMSWTDKRVIYGHLGNRISPGLKQTTVDPILIEYFVVQGKTIKWQLKE